MSISTSRTACACPLCKRHFANETRLRGHWTAEHAPATAADISRGLIVHRAAARFASVRARRSVAYAQLRTRQMQRKEYLR